MSTDLPVASAAITLDLPAGQADEYREAAAAVSAEWQLSRRWTRLVALSVRLSEDDGASAIYEISVGQTAPLDWTLEGTTALRPSLWHVREEDTIAVEAACDALVDRRHDSAEFNDRDVDEQHESAYHWIGDVVAVDPDRGSLFVSMRVDAEAPRRGAFWVEPFAFLKSLREVYSGDVSLVTSRYLPSRIRAARGDVHPEVPDQLFSQWQRNSPQAQLWQHGWSVLWGPPGTGKTGVIGREVANSLQDSDSRVLVVSTTNRATDEVAVRIGREARKIHPPWVDHGDVVRIGKSAHLETFEREGLEALLGPESIEIRRLISDSIRKLNQAESPAERARLKLQVNAAYAQLDEHAGELFFDPNIRVVVCTVYAAMRMLCDRRFGPMLDEGRAPLSTVVIDEAGLVSRAATAALSLLAADRVWLVGDARQLSPISKIERIVAENKARWMASSGLSHLNADQLTRPAVTLLSTQYRMHPEIGDVVSKFQYDGLLRHAEATGHKTWQPPPIIAEIPRAIWYVIDEETKRRSRIRASRGPGQRSWTRVLATEVLDKLFGDSEFAACEGCYITPFRGQVAAINSYLRQRKVANWTASSVHTRQGTEADAVIFDTVNAGSTGWAPHEWKRLINVGLSRARHMMILIASRDEMKEPYLQPLADLLWPAVLKSRGGKLHWQQVDPQIRRESVSIPGISERLGDQLAVRESMRPVFSDEQQRLCGLRLDGKPRLVRGVAGSGKTVVLAHWLARTVLSDIQRGDEPGAPIWVVYANMALSGLLTDVVHAAWQELNTDQAFPWDRVRFHHVNDVLDRLLIARGKYLSSFNRDINAAAEAYLKLVPKPEPVCRSMFIDESQDFGPATLRLLALLTEQAESSDQNSKNLNLFYDNAQNIYDRAMPKWTDLGVDLRGRSTVMQESFRSTRPIAEYALNVLCRLTDAAKNSEQRELVHRDLLRERKLNAGQTWWQVRYTETDGPEPELQLLKNSVLERQRLVKQLVQYVREQHVRPSQICILFNGRKADRSLRFDIAPQLKSRGIDLHVTRRESIRPDDRAITATTVHSFKGYDAELVWVFDAGNFALPDRTLAYPLYVAMTRAKSQLILSGHHSTNPTANQLLQLLRQTQVDLREARQLDTETDREDIRRELIHCLGNDHQDWIDELIRRQPIKLSPLLDSEGRIAHEPLFHFRTPLFHYVCFAAGVISKQQQQLEHDGYTILMPGDPIA